MFCIISSLTKSLNIDVLYKLSASEGFIWYTNHKARISLIFPTLSCEEVHTNCVSVFNFMYENLNGQYYHSPDNIFLRICISNQGKISTPFGIKKKNVKVHKQLIILSAHQFTIHLLYHVSFIRN